MGDKKAKRKSDKRYVALHTNILLEQDEWLNDTSKETGIPKAVLVRGGIELVREKREKESEK